MGGENGSLTIYDTEKGENISFTFEGETADVFVLDQFGFYCHIGQMVRVYHSGGSALIAVPDSEVTRLEILITTGENPHSRTDRRTQPGKIILDFDLHRPHAVTAARCKYLYLRLFCL